MTETNKFKGKCIRCGKDVPAGEGVFYFGSGSSPWPWRAHRFMRGIGICEHLTCHEKYKGTGTHYMFQPDDNGKIQID